MMLHPEFNLDNAESIIKNEIGQGFAQIFQCTAFSNAQQKDVRIPKGSWQNFRI